MLPRREKDQLYQIEATEIANTLALVLEVAIEADEVAVEEMTMTSPVAIVLDPEIATPPPTAVKAALGLESETADALTVLVVVREDVTSKNDLGEVQVCFPPNLLDLSAELPAYSSIDIDILTGNPRSEGRRTVSPSNNKSAAQSPPIAQDTEMAGTETDEVAVEDSMEGQMQAMMGFGGFGTTKQKKVKGNDVGAISKNTTTKYRQYMYAPFSVDES